MKNYFLLIILVFVLSFDCEARKKRGLGATKKGFRFGGYGSYGLTWLLNKNISDDPSIKPLISTGNEYCFELIYNFTDKIGGTLSGSKVNHNQIYEEIGVGNFKKSLQYIGINGLLKYYVIPEFYFDSGFRYNILSKASNIDYRGRNNASTSTDVTQNFSKTITCFLFGMGYEKEEIAKGLNLNIGLRYLYGLGNAINTSGAATEFPFGRYLNLSDLIPVSVGMYLGLNYKISRAKRYSH
ncbi:MAG: hypothetical protein COC01_07145 [Bacteroidetes bacterium]|nr:MAG: hypothetical protein COC01_07145 [Bacteroidota bacterium]